MKVLSFFKLKQGSTDKVVEELKSIQGIRKVSTITGVYDIVAEIEVEQPEELHDIFANYVEKIDGITETLSHLIMKTWKK